MLTKSKKLVKSSFRNRPNKMSLTVFGRPELMIELCTMKKKNDNTRLYKITLGNPTMDCRRYGICRIDDFDERTATHAPNTVLAKIKKTDTTLVFTFLRHTMTECTFKTHFSSGFFQNCLSLPNKRLFDSEKTA